MSQIFRSVGGMIIVLLILVNVVLIKENYLHPRVIQTWLFLSVALLIAAAIMWEGRKLEGRR